MTVKKAATGIKKNVIEGYRSTFGGLLMVGLCVGYYFTYEKHLYYCISGVATGLGLIIAPDQIVPIFVSTLKGILDFALSRFTKKK